MYRVVCSLVVAASLLSACGPGVDDATSDTPPLATADEVRSTTTASAGEPSTTSPVNGEVVPDDLPVPVRTVGGELALFLRPLLPHPEDTILDEALSIAPEDKSEPLNPACPPSYYLDALLQHLRLGANLQSNERKSLLETAAGYTDTAANAQRLVNGTHGIVACTDFGDDERLVTEPAADFARIDELDAAVVIRFEHWQAEYQWVLASVDNMLFSWESSTPTPLTGPSTLNADIERLMALTLDDLDEWHALVQQCTDGSSNGTELEHCAGVEDWNTTTTT